MILPLEILDLSLLDICPVEVTFLLHSSHWKFRRPPSPLNYSILPNNLCFVMPPQMHLLDCDPSPIQSLLHPSRSSNVSNLLHISVAYGRILSMSKRKFLCSMALSSDPALGWPRTLHRLGTSPCMRNESFELAIPFTSVSFAQLFWSLRNTSHFVRSHLSPSTLLALSTIKFGCQRRAVARTQPSQSLCATHSSLLAYPRGASRTKGWSFL
ncbi:hypothetical protein B296_00030448 [Ensete ventricosum]|uniref:Uncharacterized protein n=1 Tax=Ensete ventricosum TaxID=4639 RepID=A0A426ZKC5_ENSVE|nr:hypothetical protein B296_00030448 [Ensete ventricosum]